ncbi:sulfite reductase [Sphingomonas spermidinifaciens]|uniref:Sulfite reductase n=1 Tax=Sphingomonas spermidinifaciens TaxID=1141889 RepID=A0A2A4B5N0_9SPHN|nr:nitrite/sulfite reductase [Sphingomonas spermidinifaciens]PCD03089.1 sulfite reductase [Sphingomonas spermidinifaciens]
MYRYDQYDQAIVDARVAEFRDQVERRLSGALSEDQFKPLRLMNGLYLQLHAYMLRVAIPYGTLNSAQLRVLADIARRYDRGYGHFTTRQNLQYNWIQLKDAPDILAELAKVEMHAIQTSGNCIRNISSDQYAGAAADEVTDPRPWAELLRQWSTFHPEFSYLPRKFKIAVIAAPKDRAAMRLHDIGIEIVRNADGQQGARIFVGGGMGRTPMIAHEVRDFVGIDDLLSYLEACLRVYNRFGRRDNIYKARIKILLHEIGVDAYREQVEEEFLAVKQLGLDPPKAEFDRIAAFFADPPFQADAPDTIDRSDPAFALWLDQNLAAHKQPGYAIATISLKPAGGIPGDATAEQMELIADLAERYSFDELRVTHAQNLVLPHVRKADLYAVWQALDGAGLAEANLDLIGDIIACPGLDYCSLANARSIPLAQKISNRFADPERQRDLGELKLKISGCINACGHHHAGHIGILGVDRKGTENYQLLLGGSGAEDVSLGRITGPGFDEDGVVDAIERVTDLYKARREPGERFVDTYRRLGMEPFKEVIYARP